MRKRKRIEAGIEGVSTYADKMCEAGNFGQKTGRGYYDYTAGAKGRVPNPEVLDLIAEDRTAAGAVQRTFTTEEIIRRYMAAMVNEAAKVVGEEIARRPLDVDMTLLFGYGFPRYWGGPLKWADIVGLPDLLEDIATYAKNDFKFWEAAPLLKELVATSKSFESLNKKS